MTARAVHWHEGMFLQPHHFQANHRHVAERAQRAAKWVSHHNWGLRAVHVDPAALANSRLLIRSLQAVLRDGTPVAVPDDGLLPVLDLKGLFPPGATAVTVYLAVPAMNLGKANVADEAADATVAYHVDTQEFEDENTGVNPQPVRVRVPNLKLLVTGQDQTGYEVLPVVRVEKSTLANAVPQVDPTYIPPVLACDAWPALTVDILQAVVDRVGRKRERLAGLLASRGAGPVPTDPGDAVAAGQLRELNAAYAALGVLAATHGVPPLAAYVELARLVGQLAAFGRGGRWPAVPPYDHDDLGGCFWRVKAYLDDLLDVLPEPEYRERAFTGVGLRMQVALDPTWLDPAWGLFLGVRSPADPDEVVRLLTVPGQLDMKAGAGDRADLIYQLGQAGLRFEPAPRPAALPDAPGERFFRIGRQPDREWAQVVRSLTLAVRFNETRVIGTIQDQRTVTVRTGAAPAALQFTLYAVPQA